MPWWVGPIAWLAFIIIVGFMLRQDKKGSQHDQEQ